MCLETVGGSARLLKRSSLSVGGDGETNDLFEMFHWKRINTVAADTILRRSSGLNEDLLYSPQLTRSWRVLFAVARSQQMQQNQEPEEWKMTEEIDDEHEVDLFGPISGPNKFPLVRIAQRPTKWMASQSPMAADGRRPMFTWVRVCPFSQLLTTMVTHEKPEKMNEGRTCFIFCFTFPEIFFADADALSPKKMSKKRHRFASGKQKI